MAKNLNLSGDDMNLLKRAAATGCVLFSDPLQLQLPHGMRKFDYTGDEVLLLLAIASKSDAASAEMAAQAKLWDGLQLKATNGAFEALYEANAKRCRSRAEHFKNEAAEIRAAVNQALNETSPCTGSTRH